MPNPRGGSPPCVSVPGSSLTFSRLRIAAHRTARLSLLLTLLALDPFGVAQGQFVQGIVRDGTGQPVAGALVELVRGSEHVTRTLSREDGRYRLTAPTAGSYGIRVLRIGFRTTQPHTIDIPANSTLAHDLIAPMIPVRLDDVQIRAEKRCVVRPEEGIQAAALWEEARKALYATDLVQQTDGYRARIKYIERGYDRRGQRVSFENSWELDAMIRKNPFSAIDPVVLAEEGYIRVDSSKTNDETIYYAPDAHVLVSDPFTETHCFTVNDSDREDEGLIGLQFEPVEGRDVPDVHGTLWLDRRTSELRALEYKYTHLERGAARARSGGRLDFRRLASGAWIVERWWIRMPVYVTITNSGRDASVPGGVLTRRETQTRRLTAFREEGAEILSAAAVDEAMPVAAIGGTVIDHTRALPLIGAQVLALESGRRATTGPSGAFRIDSLPDGPQTLVFTHPRADSLGLTQDPFRVVARVGELTVAHLGIPARAALDANACADSLVRDGHGIIAGAVREANTDMPVADVQVVLIYEQSPGDENAGSIQATTDAQGSYLFCGVPRSGQVSLRAERGGTTTERHVLPMPRNRLTVFEIPVRLR